MLLVMVCLFVVVVVGMSLLQSSIRQSRQLRRERYKLQAFWLAESAARRAAAMLTAQPDYAGETWRVSAAELGGTFDGVVEIRLEPVQGRDRTDDGEADVATGDPPDETSSIVLVEARYPADEKLGVMQQRRFEFLNKSSGGSSE